jgi:hypothetical protein
MPQYFDLQEHTGEFLVERLLFDWALVTLLLCSPLWVVRATRTRRYSSRR